MSEADLDALFARVFARPDWHALREHLTQDIITLEEINERVSRARRRWSTKAPTSGA